MKIENNLLGNIYRVMGERNTVFIWYAIKYTFSALKCFQKLSILGYNEVHVFWYMYLTLLLCLIAWFYIDWTSFAIQTADKQLLFYMLSKKNNIYYLTQEQYFLDFHLASHIESTNRISWYHNEQRYPHLPIFVCLKIGNLGSTSFLSEVNHECK